MIYRRHSAAFEKEHGMDLPNDSQADWTPVIDCGAASTETRGFPNLIKFELVFPPFD
jgi:hypothetical protein